MPSKQKVRGPRPPWHHRAGPSVLLLLGVLLVVGLVTALLADDVAGVIPQVGKDAQGEDPWTDPVAVEKAGQYQVVRIPDCALAPVERIVLWDEDSRPYWEVSGPAASLAAFVLGATPPGFDVDVPFEEPPADAVLRIGVFRTTRGAAGVRYRQSDLRTGYAISVVSGNDTTRYEPERFTKGDVCGADGEDGSGASTTTSAVTSDVTTTVPAG